LVKGRRGHGIYEVRKEKLPKKAAAGKVPGEKLISGAQRIQRLRDNCILGTAVERNPPNSSRETAACEGPARKCRVSGKNT
jgi:hypothetical protein